MVAISVRYGVATISRLLKIMGLFCRNDRFLLQKIPIKENVLFLWSGYD